MQKIKHCFLNKKNCHGRQNVSSQFNHINSALEKFWILQKLFQNCKIVSGTMKLIKRQLPHSLPHKFTVSYQFN